MSQQRCEAARHDDPDQCSGPTAVTVVDATGDAVTGCVLHAARLLAAIESARVYPIEGHNGDAIEAFRMAIELRSHGRTAGQRTAGRGQPGTCPRTADSARPDSGQRTARGGVR